MKKQESPGLSRGEQVNMGTPSCAAMVAETIEEDGEPTVHSLSSPGLPLWQRFGLLSWEAQGCVPQPLWSHTEDDE